MEVEKNLPPLLFAVLGCAAGGGFLFIIKKEQAARFSRQPIPLDVHRAFATVHTIFNSARRDLFKIQMLGRKVQHITDSKQLPHSQVFVTVQLFV